MEFKPHKRITKVNFEGIDMKLPNLALTTKKIIKEGIYNAAEDGVAGYSLIEVSINTETNPQKITIPIPENFKEAINTRSILLTGISYFKLYNYIIFAYHNDYTGLYIYDIVTQKTTQLYNDGSSYSTFQQISPNHILIGGGQKSHLLLLDIETLSITVLVKSGYLNKFFSVINDIDIISSDGISGSGEGSYIFNRLNLSIKKLSDKRTNTVIIKDNYIYLINTDSRCRKIIRYDLATEEVLEKIYDSTDHFTSNEAYIIYINNYAVFLRSSYAGTTTTNKALTIFNLDTFEWFTPDIPSGYGYWGYASIPKIEIEGDLLYLLGTSKSTHPGMYIVNVETKEIKFIDITPYYVKREKLNTNYSILVSEHTGSTYPKDLYLLNHNTFEVTKFNINCWIYYSIVLSNNKVLLISRQSPLCIYELDIENKIISDLLYTNTKAYLSDRSYCRYFPEQNKVLLITNSGGSIIEYNTITKTTIDLFSGSSINKIEDLNKTINDNHLIKINDTIIYAYNPLTSDLFPWAIEYTEV